MSGIRQRAIDACYEQALKSYHEGGLPIGSTLTRGDEIIAVGHNRRVQQGNPILHGEMDCLQNAGRQTSYRDCTLYTSLSPCMMCSGTIVQFKIPHVVICENRSHLREPQFRRERAVPARSWRCRRHRRRSPLHRIDGALHCRERRAMGGRHRRLNRTRLSLANPGAARHGNGMIIAVDGPTASGKGTIARALAAHFGLPHLDTGLLYRAVGRQCALNGGNPDDPADARAACTFPDSLLDDPELRSEATGGLASRVSIHSDVRKALYERQRSFATQPGGAILDGRDIGTVIAPEADAKLFVTASVEARAERRHSEMLEQDRAVSIEDITADLAARDKRDRTRKDSPLVVAEDALVIETSGLRREEAIAAAIAAVDALLAEHR
ncbi:hypothetical protein GCM10011349_15490 [Novosphingobium indicum]|uniref:Cytidylate kinase n=2 Tax=Novosphingobium indicum TaxID=462949 RepID=A0ABQ2JI62_9SPHN|nr:hypothetical protein GCM10011349_15490 [Novosphingobium indicum]